MQKNLPQFFGHLLVIISIVLSSSSFGASGDGAREITQPPGKRRLCEVATSEGSPSKKQKTATQPMIELRDLPTFLGIRGLNQEFLSFLSIFDVLALANTSKGIQASLIQHLPKSLLLQRDDIDVFEAPQINFWDAFRFAYFQDHWFKSITNSALTVRKFTNLQACVLKMEGFLGRIPSNSVILLEYLMLEKSQALEIEVPERPNKLAKLKARINTLDPMTLSLRIRLKTVHHTPTGFRRLKNSESFEYAMVLAQQVKMYQPLTEFILADDTLKPDKRIEAAEFLLERTHNLQPLMVEVAETFSLVEGTSLFDKGYDYLIASLKTLTPDPQSQSMDEESDEKGLASNYDNQLRKLRLPGNIKAIINAALKILQHLHHEDPDALHPLNHLAQRLLTLHQKFPQHGSLVFCRDFGRKYLEFSRTVPDQALDCLGQSVRFFDLYLLTPPLQITGRTYAHAASAYFSLARLDATSETLGKFARAIVLWEKTLKFPGVTPTNQDYLNLFEAHYQRGLRQTDKQERLKDFKAALKVHKKHQRKIPDFEPNEELLQRVKEIQYELGEALAAQASLSQDPMQPDTGDPMLQVTPLDALDMR